MLLLVFGRFLADQKIPEAFIKATVSLRVRSWYNCLRKTDKQAPSKETSCDEFNALPLLIRCRAKSTELNLCMGIRF